MNLESYCIPHRERLLGQTTKQPLSYFEPWTFENITNFEGWGLSLIAYKKNKCIIEKLTSSTKSFPQNANKFFCHTHRETTPKLK